MTISLFIQDNIISIAYTYSLITVDVVVCTYTCRAFFFNKKIIFQFIRIAVLYRQILVGTCENQLEKCAQEVKKSVSRFKFKYPFLF